MKTQFQIDLAEAKKVEQLVLEHFQKLTNEYTFINVSDEPQYYHKGDIIAVAPDGRKIFIEVKNDASIGNTNNVLCEEENYFYNTGEIKKGNFYSDYQIYCVVSQDKRKIWVMDFKVLKAHYKSGEPKRKYHPTQISDFYLLPLYVVKRHNGLIAELDY